MSEKQAKLGFWGWALSGGIYFSNVRGSGLGGLGSAMLICGTSRIWKTMAAAPTPEIREKLLPLLLISGIFGVIFLGMGYFKYLGE